MNFYTKYLNEILYRKVDRIPLQKRYDALISRLDSLYIEIENIIDCHALAGRIFHEHQSP